MLKNDLKKKCPDVYSEPGFFKDFGEYREKKIELFTNILLKSVSKDFIENKCVKDASRLIPFEDCMDCDKVFDTYLTVRRKI